MTEKVEITPVQKYKVKPLKKRRIKAGAKKVIVNQKEKREIRNGMYL